MSLTSTAPAEATHIDPELRDHSGAFCRSAVIDGLNRHVGTRPFSAEPRWT